MSYMEEISGNIYYITEVEINEEKLYIFTKHVALHFPDMGRKFLHKRSAARYYGNSEFKRMNCKYRILKYNKKMEKIIE